MRRVVFASTILLSMALGAAGQDDPTVAAELVKNPAVKAALDAAKANEAQTIEDQIRFCEVPAPPFQERARGELLRRTFAELHLQDVRVDRAGNVLGEGYAAGIGMTIGAVFGRIAGREAARNGRN